MGKLSLADRSQVNWPIGTEHCAAFNKNARHNIMLTGVDIGEKFIQKVGAGQAIGPIAPQVVMRVTDRQGGIDCFLVSEG
jgi:hypothetical protein